MMSSGGVLIFIVTCGLTFLIGLLPMVKSMFGSRTKKSTVLTWCAFIGALVWGSYHYAGQYEQLDRWQHAQSRLPELTKRLAGEQNAPFSQQDLSDLTLSLRTHLYARPEDAKGWHLLGSILMAQKDRHQAQQAYSHAARLNPTTLHRFDLAKTQLGGSEYDKAAARASLGKLLTENYQPEKVLVLLALDALSLKQSQQLEHIVGQLSAYLPENDGRMLYLAQQLKLLKMSQGN